jgi:peroxiredoxin
MALTPSKMLALGTEAPAFRLPDTEGHLVGLENYPEARGYLVMFICNHCPYVKHIRQELGRLTSEYMEKGISVFGINSNDVVNYPDDSPEKMRSEKKLAGYSFPYLFDETQSVAKAYDAACTPDFFLFDSHHKLVYRGQFDESRPGNRIPVTGSDLKSAFDAVLGGWAPDTNQKPSVGCNIKWK